MKTHPQPKTLLSIALPLEMAAVLNKKARHHISEDLVKGLHWIGPECYHIMLHDLGCLEAHQHSEILENVVPICQLYHPFHAITGSCQLLPDHRQPHALATLVHSGGYLQKLHDHIADHIGLQEYKKSYRPSITLAHLDPLNTSLYRPEWILPSIELNVSRLCLSLYHPGNHHFKVIEPIALGSTEASYA